MSAFVESEVDKRSKLYKKIKSLGYAAEMTRQDITQLSRWAGSLLAREGKDQPFHNGAIFEYDRR